MGISSAVTAASIPLSPAPDSATACSFLMRIFWTISGSSPCSPPG